MWFPPPPSPQYPTERERRQPSLAVRSWEGGAEESGPSPHASSEPPVAIYDMAFGPAPSLRAHWSSHYQSTKRDPLNFTLAPWVRDLFRGSVAAAAAAPGRKGS